jgi:hypothetical protein
MEPDLDMQPTHRASGSLLKALVFAVGAVALSLSSASCAKSLSGLSPFPCAGDGSCPDGFYCSANECVESSSGSGTPIPVQTGTTGSSSSGSMPVSGGNTIHGIGGLCLDVFHSMPESTLVDVYSCNGTDAQIFTFTSNGGLANYWGYCLDVVSFSASFGTLAFMPCTGSPTQQWQQSGQQIRGPYGECLDVKGGSTVPGTSVDLWTCNGTAAQNWTIP